MTVVSMKQSHTRHKFIIFTRQTAVDPIANHGNALLKTIGRLLRLGEVRALASRDFLATSTRGWQSFIAIQIHWMSSWQFHAAEYARYPPRLHRFIRPVVISGITSIFSCDQPPRYKSNQVKHSSKRLEGS